jgi:hypothetical protein
MRTLLCLQLRRCRRSSLVVYRWLAPEAGTLDGKTLAEKGNADVIGAVPIYRRSVTIDAHEAQL